ncbi:MAG: glycosyltransferase [Verrucomicrobiota bacterium]
MRVATFATSRAGGAGHAAERIVVGLRELGEEVSWVVPSKSGLVEKAASQLHDHALDFSRAGRSNTIFTTTWPTRFDRKNSEIEKADLFHLHWINRFLSPSDIGKLGSTGKPIVWTLHDQRPFTGGCHFTDGCEQFRTRCTECPQLDTPYQWIAEKNQEDVLRSYGEMNICFVGPSEWITSEVRASALYSSEHHRSLCIPPGVDTDEFYPSTEARKRVREGLGISDDRIVIVTGAHNLSEHRKGFDLVRKSFQQFSSQASDEDRERILLLTYGQGCIGDTGVEEMAIGTVPAKSVIGLLQASDLYFLMTRQDVGPTVILEAISCGLPVLAPNVGGVPEMVEDGKNGWIVPYEGDEEAGRVISAIASGTREERERMGENSRRKAIEEFSNEKQAAAYRELFQELISEGEHRPRKTAQTDPKSSGREGRFLIRKAALDFRFYKRVVLYALYRTKNRVRLALVPVWPLKKKAEPIDLSMLEG